MADMYITGEPAGNWETAVGNSAYKEYEVDVTGINDMQLLEQYMQEHAGAIPYEMINGKKVYMRYAKLPENNTSVTLQGITSLIQGTAGYLTGYTGEGFWTRIASSTIANAIMRSMYLAIDASKISGTIPGLLENALDRFKITDSDDIPVYVDSGGVAYVLQDAVEAIREKLIELGAYEEGYEPGVMPGDSATFICCPARYSYTVTIGKARYEEVYPYCYITDKFYTGNAGATAVKQVAYAIKDDDTIHFDNVAVLASVPNAGSTTCGLTILGFSNTVPKYPEGYYDLYYSDGSVATYGNGIYKAVSDNGDTYYYVNSGLANQDTALVSQNNPGIVLHVGNYPNMSSECLVYSYINGEGAEAIPGLTVSDVIPMGFGDLALPLDDVVPGWAVRGKDVATPDEDNIWAKSRALPLDVPLDDIWTDGYAGDSADTYDGDLADILKDALIDVLPDILDDIIDNTDVTEADVYDIPAGDTGNTPPAEPPILNGSSNGLWTMYNPTKAEVNSFGAWLWSDTLIDQIIRQFNSPIDAVIGFHQIYCTPVTGASKVIKAGFLDSPVSAAEVTNQYVTIDCGQVSVTEYYGNALDYDNTQVSIFLPFVGIVPLNTNVVMGSVLHVIYRIDVFTGTCLAQIKVIKENSNAVMYAFEGNCAVQIPLTGTTYTGMVGALLGGLSASVSFMAGDMLHAGASALSALTSAGTGLTGVKQSGNMGANAGSLGIRIPYLIITRSASAMPAGFEGLRGIPSTELVTLGSLSGFTSVRDVHLEGIPATADELNEIKELLAEGVIL